jgi:hypothetical protein
MQLRRRYSRGITLNRPNESVGEPYDAITKPRDIGVVRDEQARRTEPLVDLQNRLEHADTRRDIERARRFVTEQYARSLGDRASDRDTLLFTARELSREMRHALT